MKKLSCLYIIAVIKFILMFEQDLYNLIYERGEVTWLNKSYMGELKLHNFKYNRTQAATNMTIWFRKALGTNMTIRVQAYKFMSNEYRLFALRFQFDFCEYAAKNEFGLHRLFECGNWSCPLRTGHYHVCNFSCDGKRFPPLVPEGKWKINLLYIDTSNQAAITEIDFYASICYPLV